MIIDYKRKIKFKPRVNAEKWDEIAGIRNGTRIYNIIISSHSIICLYQSRNFLLYILTFWSIVELFMSQPIIKYLSFILVILYPNFAGKFLFPGEVIIIYYLLLSYILEYNICLISFN